MLMALFNLLLEEKRVNIFLKGISLKMNAIVWLESEHAYCDAWFHEVSHYPDWTIFRYNDDWSLTSWYKSELTIFTTHLELFKKEFRM